MPRAPKKTAQEIYTALKGLIFKSDNGEFLPYKDSIWQEASDHLQGALGKSYVYLYVTQNRIGLSTLLHGEDKANYNVRNKSQSDVDQSMNSNWSMNNLNNNLPELRAEVYMPETDWVKIKPQAIFYKNRAYDVLNPGWTDEIYDYLWTELKLPCGFAFKNAKISLIPGEIFLKIHGTCSECGSQINIYSPTEPVGNGLHMYISTFDTREISHTNKRFLRGSKRKRVIKELREKTTYAWRREQANELMEFGDVEPAHLYNEKVLRKAKQLEETVRNSRDEELGLNHIKDPIWSLIQLKYGLEFSGCVHQIGLDHFFVMYWTPEQIFLYNQFLKDNDVGSISIDATGSLVKSLPKPDGSKKVVFLYQAVTSLNGKILPLFQMISEKHDANMITYWIREWLRSGVSCPKEIVTDYSLALLNAAALALNNVNLTTYVENCFDSLVTSHQELPACVIRIDIAHLIKLVCRWACFSQKPAIVKDFFVRCIGILTKCTSVDRFRAICTDVLTVAFAETEDVTDEMNHCYSAQKRLLVLLKTEVNISSDPELNLFAVFEDTDSEIHTELGSGIQRFLSEVECESKSSHAGQRPNPYFCDGFATQLLRLSKNCLLWTAVVSAEKAVRSAVPRPHLVATSARSEEYFREVKSLIFKGAKSVRVDKFLVIHLRSLIGTMKILHANCSATQLGSNVKLLKVRNTTQIKRELNEREHVPTHDDSSHSAVIVGNRQNLEKRRLDVDNQSESFHDIVTIPNRIVSRLDKPIPNATSTLNDSQSDDLPAFIRNSTSNKELVSDHVSSIQKSNANSELALIGIPALDDKIVSVETLLCNTDSLLDDESKLNDNFKTNDKSFLNYVESWRGLMNESNEQRGKYLTPCADIESIHKRPKFSRILPLLINGNSLLPVKVGNQAVYLRNTCPFDVIAQSVLAAYRDWNSYNAYLNQTSHQLFDFVKEFSAKGATQKIYSLRANILCSFVRPVNGVARCETNISTMISEKLPRDIPSYLITKQCLDCKYEKKITHSVLNINTVPIYTKGMAGLREAISQCGQEKNQSCYRCRSRNVESTFGGENHLFLDLECLEWTPLAAQLGFPDWKRQFTLSELLVDLEFDKSTYKLVAAIEFVGIPNEVGHYIAYIRRISGKWEEHNGTCREKKPMMVTSRILLQKKRRI